MPEALNPKGLTGAGSDRGIGGTTGDGIKACIRTGAKFDEIHGAMNIIRRDRTTDRADIAMHGSSRIVPFSN